MENPGNKHDIWKDYALLALLCVCSFFLYVFNNDFPLYFHADEIKKIHFVLQGEQDFKHPVLLLQLARLANLIFQENDPQALAILCRQVSALAGVGIIIASYFLALQLLSAKQALFAALVVSVSPILVVHAHYYKEDMVFTASALFSLFFYLRYLQNRVRGNFIGLCIAAGFVLSAQYKAVLLIPLFLIFPLLDRRVSKKNLYKNLVLMIGIALAIAVVINYPALRDFKQLVWGISKETEHLSFGHTVKIYPMAHLFSFHLINSLLPGLTVLVLLLSLIGLINSIIKWQTVATGYRLAVVYILVYYLAHEITPMKPAPGFIRYMIPVAPVLLILSVSGVDALKSLASSVLPGTFSRLPSLALYAALVAIPLYDSVMIVANFNEKDTRVEAFNWLSERQDEGEVYFGKQTLMPNKQSGRIYTLNERRMDGLRAAGFKYAIASSFGYDVYFSGAELQGQSSKVYRVEKQFEEIFSNYPYYEFKPKFKSFAYSNPVIRIIDISQKPRAGQGGQIE